MEPSRARWTRPLPESGRTPYLARSALKISWWWTNWRTTNFLSYGAAQQAAPFFVGRFSNSQISPALCRWFPLVQKCQKIFRSERSRILEFAIFLAVNQLPIGIKHGQSWNSTLHRNLVLLHQVLILFSLSDIDVYNLVVGEDYRRQV